jgi:hypothetical protein
MPESTFDSTVVVVPLRVAFVPTTKLTVVSSPFGFTTALRTAFVEATEVADDVVAVGFTPETVKLCVAEALTYTPELAAVATMEHVPDVRTVTVEPETLHTEGVALE